MHTAQIILVEIEDKETDDPQTFAEGFLNNVLESGGSWFDWFGEGAFGNGLAGRWSGDVIEGDVLCYADNPELAEKVISEFIEQRQREVEYAQSVIDGTALDSLSYDFDNQTSHERVGYALYTMGKILTNDWCAETGVFDSKHWSANLDSFRERVQKNPENQYLVVVDFHH
jgi:hypothetical protein